MTLYADIEIHGTPAGYKAGCKTDQMCDDSAPWSCKRAYERSRGEYEFRRRVDAGMTPLEIQAAERSDAQRAAELDAAWREREGVTPAKKPKVKKKPAPAVPDRLAAYGANGPAAMERIASAPSITDLATFGSALALARSRQAVTPTPSKETPMIQPQDAELEWKRPPAAALDKRKGRRGGYAWHIAQMKSKRTEWACIGRHKPGAETRWRTGKVAGTQPHEFEAVLDDRPEVIDVNGKGLLYVRYVGGAK